MGNSVRDFIVVLYYAAEASWLHLLWKFLFYNLRKEESMHIVLNLYLSGSNIQLIGMLEPNDLW